MTCCRTYKIKNSVMLLSVFLFDNWTCNLKITHKDHKTTNQKIRSNAAAKDKKDTPNTLKGYSSSNKILNLLIRRATVMTLEKPDMNREQRDLS